MYIFYKTCFDAFLTCFVFEKPIELIQCKKKSNEYNYLHYTHSATTYNSSDIDSQ